MGLDNETGRAFGVAEPLHPGSNKIRIKVLGIIGTGLQKLTSENARRMFPPSGYVFAFDLFEKAPELKENELLQFSYTLSDYTGFDLERYVISSKAKRLGSPLIAAKGFTKSYKSIDLSKLELIETGDKSNFYVYVQDRFIIGKLSCRNGQISNPPKSVKMWDRDENTIVNYNNHFYLFDDPAGDYTILDCLNDKQLVEWFREKLKVLNSDWVTYLDQKTSWRSEMPLRFLPTEDDDLESIRMEKIKGMFENLELTAQELIRIFESSDVFKQLFETSIEKHKEQFMKNHGIQVERLERDAKEKEKTLNDALVNVRKQLKIEQQSLSETEKKIQKYQLDIEHLEKDKHRLLADFSIISDVFKTQERQPKSASLQPTYILEEMLPESASNLFSKEELIDRVKYYLAIEGYDQKIAELLTNTILSYKGVFISELEIAICFLKAFGNVKFIIQATEVGWLNFKDFWDSGLGDLWNSASEYPNQLHVLMLQDVNLASPECYARPLLDMFTGLRKKIPFAGTQLPKNFRVIATKASTDNPRIGLPLIRQTFKGWGELGFSFPIELIKDQPVKDKPVSGYCDFQQTELYLPTGLEKDILLDRNKRITTPLFDQ